MRTVKISTTAKKQKNRKINVAFILTIILILSRATLHAKKIKSKCQQLEADREKSDLSHPLVPSRYLYVDIGAVQQQNKANSESFVSF